MQNKKKNPKLTELDKLHPLDREKALKKLLNNDNKDFLKIIKEEIEKTELEREHISNLEKVSAKKNEEEKSLDDIVQKNSEIEEIKEKDTKSTGQLYSAKIQSTYEIYSVYDSHKNEPLNVHAAHNDTTDKVTSGIREENLSSNFALNKTTDLYTKKKKGEVYGH